MIRLSRALVRALSVLAASVLAAPALAQPPSAQPPSAQPPGAQPPGSQPPGAPPAAAAPAPPPEDPHWAEATRLFLEGRALLARPGQLDRACETLAKSYALRARGDTLLNLAECHRRQGKTATAWREFDEAIRFAMQVEFPEAIAAAVLLRDELAKKLSELVVEVDDASLPKALEITLDGKRLPQPQWNQPLFVDPGVHVVSATAPGYEPFEGSVEVPPKGGRTLLPVTPKALPPPPAPPPPPPPTAPPPPPKERAPAELPVWPFVVGGAGLVSIGVATVFGLDSLSAGAELDERCGADRQACPEAYDFEDVRGRELRGFGFYLGFGLAGIGATTAGVLGILLADGRADAEVGVAPWIGPDGGGVSVRGATF